MRRGVIFDIDGTLVDSNDAHAESWARTLAEFGYDVPAARVRPLIGMGGDKLLPELIGVDIESELGKQLAKRRGELFAREYVPRLRPFPRARELAERLRSDGYILIVASSAGEDQLEKLIEVSGVGDLLADTTSADDAERSKPDPDIVHAALSRGGLSAGAGDAVMIGDTPYDVEASLRAGVVIIGVRSGGWSDNDLEGAAAIYDDVAELLREYDRSLLAQPR
jgi:phosphoglycolate phosphatase-like HAD superfamily hydrolase